MSTTQEISIVSSYDECLESFAQANSSSVLQLTNPPFSIHYLGAFYLWQMVQQAAAQYPTVDYRFICDCDNDAMAVIQALQSGFTMIRYQGAAEIMAKVRDIVGQYRAVME